MKIIDLKCPKCGAELTNVTILDGLSDTFCSFCGEHIYLDTENVNVNIHRTEDAYKIKQLEQYSAELKEAQAKDRARRKILIKIFPVVLTIGIILIFLAESSGDPNSSFYAPGMILITISMGLGIGFLPISDSNVRAYYKEINQNHSKKKFF